MTTLFCTYSLHKVEVNALTLRRLGPRVIRGGPPQEPGERPDSGDEEELPHKVGVCVCVCTCVCAGAAVEGSRHPTPRPPEDNPVPRTLRCTRFRRSWIPDLTTATGKFGVYSSRFCVLQPVVQSSVIATPQDTRTRQDKLKEEDSSSKESKQRSVLARLGSVPVRWLSVLEPEVKSYSRPAHCNTQLRNNISHEPQDCMPNFCKESGGLRHSGAKIKP